VITSKAAEKHLRPDGKQNPGRQLCTPKINSCTEESRLGVQSKRGELRKEISRKNQSQGRDRNILAAALLAHEKKKWESKLRPGEQKEPQIGENVTRRRKQENKPVRWHHKSSGDREQETEASRKMNKGCGLLRAREKSRATAVRVTKSKRRKKL
jgi:hypothetical protein